MIRPQAISADTIYSAAELEQRGITENALREASKHGLPVHRIGRTVFVLGADLIAHLKQPDKPPAIHITGSLPIEALAELLLTSQECFNCGDQAADYIDSGQWAGRHVCRRCFESLPSQREGEADGA